MTASDRAPSSPCKGEVARRDSGGSEGVEGRVRFSSSAGKVARARKLRRSLSLAEVRLWAKLKSAQLCEASFRRQHPAGSYVLDFYCAEIGLAIELDGGQHGYPGQFLADKRRTDWLAARGVTVLRFWNNEVLGNTDGVLQVIAETVIRLREQRQTPSRRWRADLPLSGGGGHLSIALHE